jgi:hypothetical protein
MSTSLGEAQQEAHEQVHGYDLDILCSGCGTAAIGRFLNGEPVEESAMQCGCGGEFEAA